MQELSIVTSKGDDAVEKGYAKIHSKSNTSVTVEFTRAGLYEISINGYNFNGARTVTYGFEPIVEN